MPAPVPAQALITQTLLLAFRLAFVWAGGILLAVVTSALLPDQAGINFPGKDAAHFLPFSRIGFWTCIWAAVTVTVLVVVRAMMADLSGRS